MSRPDDPIATLQQEFRHHLQTFYAQLHLAPPYHSVERAISRLTASLRALSPEERARVASEPPRRWAQFTEAFAASGLPQKHRGIVLGLLRRGQAPVEYRSWLALYEESPEASSARTHRSS